jgi:hypothetical protein
VAGARGVLGAAAGVRDGGRGVFGLLCGGGAAPAGGAAGVRAAPGPGGVRPAPERGDSADAGRRAAGPGHPPGGDGGRHPTPLRCGEAMHSAPTGRTRPSSFTTT